MRFSFLRPLEGILLSVSMLMHTFPLIPQVGESSSQETHFRCSWVYKSFSIWAYRKLSSLVARSSSLARWTNFNPGLWPSLLWGGSISLFVLLLLNRRCLRLLPLLLTHAAMTYYPLLLIFQLLIAHQPNEHLMQTHYSVSLPSYCWAVQDEIALLRGKCPNKSSRVWMSVRLMWALKFSTAH